MHTTEQFKADVQRILEAYQASGLGAATDVYLEIVMERELVRWETVALRGAVYTKIIELNKENATTTKEVPNNES